MMSVRDETKGKMLMLTLPYVALLEMEMGNRSGKVR